MRTLLADIDTRTTLVVTQALQNQPQASLTLATTGEDTLTKIANASFDVVLIGCMLLDMDGCEAIRRIRRVDSGLPLLWLSRSQHPTDHRTARKAGADDVVVIPVEPTKLLAQIQRPRHAPRHLPSAAPLSVGPVYLNPLTCQVTVSGAPLQLTIKEFGVLEMLMRRTGRPISKTEFLDHLYQGEDEPEAKIIDVFICKLRRKLAHAGADGMIATAWGRGYKLILPHEEIGPAERSRSFLPADASERDASRVPAHFH